MFTYHFFQLFLSSYNILSKSLACLYILTIEAYNRYYFSFYIENILNFVGSKLLILNANWKSTIDNPFSVIE